MCWVSKFCFVARKQESLTFVNIVFLANNTVSFGTCVHKTKDTLNYIHSDVCGPSQVPSKGGVSYLLTLIDIILEKFGCILSIIRAMYLLQAMKGYDKKTNRKKVKRLRTERDWSQGVWSILQNWRNYATSYSSVHTTTEWRCKKDEHDTIGESSVLLSNAGLSKCFWAEAVNIVAIW